MLKFSTDLYADSPIRISGLYVSFDRRLSILLASVTLSMGDWVMMNSLLLGWCSHRLCASALLHSSANCAGWKRGRESISSSSSTSVSSTEQHRRTFLANRRTSRLHVVYVPPLHRRWLLYAIINYRRPSPRRRHSSRLERSTVARHHHCHCLPQYGGFINYVTLEGGEGSVQCDILWPGGEGSG